ncbi:hypothetical protein BH11PSE7_BH11PSE7_28880 [soil metagenome]
MIYLICPGSRSQAGEVVAAALRRSCGAQAVQPVTAAAWHALLVAGIDAAGPRAIFVVIDPLAAWAPLVARTRLVAGAKLLVLGALEPALAASLGAVVTPVTDAMREAAQCLPAPSRGQTQSALGIAYVQAVGGTDCPMAHRPLMRYDFTDEWNNLGYGAVRVDGSIWALAQRAEVPAANVVAELTQDGVAQGAYACLWDDAASSLLWFNRAAGPIDSQEWLLVERFMSSHRHGQLVCQPVIREIPHGYAAAVTMRLDCDEDVESARPLYDAYQAMAVPFSLALHATVLADAQHHQLPREVAATGGAILSHTATHAPDWGGSYEAAYAEGASSAASILAATALAVRHAVSPFHQTPAYARAGLADAGYAGCIGGIIRNDPDFLMARAGVPPGGSAGFIGHSQQCMLHGDCMLAGADPLAIFKQAFTIAMKGGAFFGYLDHPFSPRYQYGWNSEPERLQAHRDFVGWIKGHSNVLFANENEAMDFLHWRSRIDVAAAGNGYAVISPAGSASWPAAVEYRGAVHRLGAEGLAL